MKKTKRIPRPRIVSTALAQHGFGRMKDKVPKPSKKATAPDYTHRDGSGMPWRFVGSRPVSKLADQVMMDCGLPIPK